MTMDEFIREALAVPFKDKGRDYKAWDCYGLLYCFFKDVRGIELPSYVDDYKDAGNSEESRKELSELIAGNKGRWEQVLKYQDRPLRKVSR